MSITLPTQNLTIDRTQLTLRAPSEPSENWSRKLFAFCLLFIVSVSIYDTYLVTLYRDSILLDERNPVCLYLIQQDTSQLTWFILGKLAGNLVVVGTLLGLFLSGFRNALTVAKGVAFFQLLLLIYLQFSDPLTGILDFDGFVSASQEDNRQAILSVVAHLGVVVPALMGSVIAKRKWDSKRMQAIC